MGNASWICFDCRDAVRRDTQYQGDVACPKCGEPMRYLGYKIPVPPKRDEKAWQLLHEQLNREHLECQQQSIEAAVRRRHELEQEIARLGALPPNPGREKAIRLLREQLDRA
jgi:hypothetical protein